MIDSAHKKLLIYRSLAYALLITMAISAMLPLFISFVNATRSDGDIQTSVSLIPGTKLISNITGLINSRIHFFRALFNSITVSVFTVVVTVYFGTLTAYAFACFKFKGKNLCFMAVMLTLLVPPQVSLVGFYNLIVQMRLVDTYYPLILPGLANSFVIFFLKQYIETSLNTTYLEAARIDGASEFLIFNKIVFPMLMPGVATMALLAFIRSWNNYLLPLVVINTPEKSTLPMVINNLKALKHESDWGIIYTGTSFSVLPILIMFLIFSKKMMNSVSLGGVKE